jgi:ERCC4-type nuclease
MKLKVDNREHELINRMNHYIKNVPHFNSITFDIETLDIGDILYLDDDDKDQLIIERKSVNDLLSSIKDGRYNEQSYRLNGLELHNHNIIYLIEGDILTHFNLAVYSAMVSLNYHKGFSVTRTFNVDETAIFVCNTLLKLKKTNKPSFYLTQPNKCEQSDNNMEQVENSSNANNGTSYCSVIKKAKKENITPSNIGEIMLSQIPGISSVTSIAIMKQFLTIPNLINSVEADPSCLENITYITSNGQSRKINKASVDLLRKYLIQK